LTKALCVIPKCISTGVNLNNLSISPPPIDSILSCTYLNEKYLEGISENQVFLKVVSLSHFHEREEKLMSIE